jgi:hypothetical protein
MSHQLSKSKYDKKLVVDGDGRKEWVSIFLLLCSFASYDWWHLIFLWLLLWVSFVWCVVATLIFFVGCQSRAGGSWSSSTKDFGNSWQLNILSFCV